MKLFLLPFLLLGTAYGLSVNSDSFQPIIEKVNSLQTTWKAGDNFGPHETVSSIKKLLGAKKSERKLPSRGKLFTNVAIPAEFDARKKWPQCPTLSKISDQSNCGSCWAVASADAFSDRLCISSNGTFTAPLSSYELLSCCNECGNGCFGGMPGTAWEYFEDHGIVTGGLYGSKIGCQPYPFQPCEHHISGSFPECSSLPDFETPACNSKCTNSEYSAPAKSDHHRVKRSYSIESEEEIQHEIMNHGPVVAMFRVFADFPTYKSGVYQYTTGSEEGRHAVRVIGWGTENGIPYWLIANSWNMHWGDQGTFKILRGKNECEIEEEVVAGIPA